MNFSSILPQPFCCFHLFSFSIKIIFLLPERKFINQIVSLEPPSMCLPCPFSPCLFSPLPFTGTLQWSCQFTTNMAQDRAPAGGWPSWLQPSGYWPLPCLALSSLALTPQVTMMAPLPKPMWLIAHARGCKGGSALKFLTPGQCTL